MLKRVQKLVLSFCVIAQSNTLGITYMVLHTKIYLSAIRKISIYKPERYIPLTIGDNNLNKI